MKKCMFVLGLLLFSSSCVFAHCCACYENYGCRYYNCPKPRPHAIRHNHFIANYPQTGISINIGNRYPYNTRIINRRHGLNNGRFGASIHVSI